MIPFRSNHSRIGTAYFRLVPRASRNALTVMPVPPAATTISSARSMSAGREHEIGGDADDEAGFAGRVDRVATDPSGHEVLHGGGLRRFGSDRRHDLLDERIVLSVCGPMRGQRDRCRSYG